MHALLPLLVIVASVNPPAAEKKAKPGCSTVQIKLTSPETMRVSWDGAWHNLGRRDLASGTHHFKLSTMIGDAEVRVSASIKISRLSPKLRDYTARNSVPLTFSIGDVRGVLTKRSVTKVVLLPDEKHRELSVDGIEIITSSANLSRAEAIQAARSRGEILAILRIGAPKGKTPRKQRRATRRARRRRQQRQQRNANKPGKN